MDTEGKALAQALYDSAANNYTETFSVPKSDNEVIVVVALRTTRDRGVVLRKSVRTLHEIVAGPMGDVCICCNGTGRAR